jgi:hypothetical protein
MKEATKREGTRKTKPIRSRLSATVFAAFGVEAFLAVFGGFVDFSPLDCVCAPATKKAKKARCVQ